MTLRVLALLLVLPLVGCVSKRPYEAKVDLVQKEGLEETRQSLVSVMKKATIPRVGLVEFTPKAMRFRHVVIGPFDQPMHHGVWTVIDFDAFTSVEIYENNRAFVYVNKQERVWLQFAVPIDAERFDDLLTSLATHAKTAK